jgi:hypothetical protein
VRCPFGEIARRAERSQLFGDRNIDQLVERDALRLGQLPRLFEAGRAAAAARNCSFSFSFLQSPQRLAGRQGGDSKQLLGQRKVASTPEGANWK